jgi:hypothetical protein
MTKTHEERVREIVNEFVNPDWPDDLVPIADAIATAFREVEQETLERAAKTVERFFEVVFEGEKDVIGSDLAASIRALGTEVET